MTVDVTPEQARLLKGAFDAQQQAVQSFQYALTVLTAGLVPAGSQLTGIDTEHGTLVFAGGTDG